MENPILYVNACVREDSRTGHLADKLLEKLGQPYEEVRLHALSFPTADEAFLRLRDRRISEGTLEDPMFALARQFARAETVVIAAPYWDLSFPAALKQYFEQINVVGITFRYSAEGVPVGLCRAKALYYVTTAGGGYAPEEFGFGYVSALARGDYGIPRVKQIKAVGLDLDGADVNGILKAAEAAIAGLDLPG